MSFYRRSVVFPTVVLALSGTVGNVDHVVGLRIKSGAASQFPHSQLSDNESNASGKATADGDAPLNVKEYLRGKPLTDKNGNSIKCRKVIRNEKGDVIYDENGKPKTKHILNGLYRFIHRVRKPSTDLLEGLKDMKDLKGVLEEMKSMKVKDASGHTATNTLKEVLEEMKIMKASLKDMKDEAVAFNAVEKQLTEISKKVGTVGKQIENGVERPDEVAERKQREQELFEHALKRRYVRRAVEKFRHRRLALRLPDYSPERRQLFMKDFAEVAMREIASTFERVPAPEVTEEEVVAPTPPTEEEEEEVVAPTPPTEAVTEDQDQTIKAWKDRAVELWQATMTAAETGGKTPDETEAALKAGFQPLRVSQIRHQLGLRAGKTEDAELKSSIQALIAEDE